MAKRGLTYIKGEEPNFLKKFKQQIGYKEDPTVEDKFRKNDQLARGPDPDEEEKDDEKPSVVQLGASDLNAEEAEAEWRRCQAEAELRSKDERGVGRGPPTDERGKIRFRKPKKKEESDAEDEKKEEEEKCGGGREDKGKLTEKGNKESKEKKEKKEKRDKKRDVKAVKNSKLLSFGEDEEEEEEES